MKMFLSSFGLGTSLFHSYFHRMPAISMSEFGPTFVPDYPVLFLFDEFVIDSRTAERVRESDARQYYKEMADLIDVLDAAGRLQTVDYDSLVEPYAQPINEAVEYDLRNIDTWASAFEESIDRWNRFSVFARGILEEKQTDGELSYEERELLDVFEHGYYGHSVTLARSFGPLLKKWRSKMDPMDRKYARHVVGEYLRYISNNLCLSDLLDAAIHDWTDIEPLYRKKLKVSLRGDGDEAESQQVRQLFSVMFPDFRPKDARALGRALEDKRIESLRELVSTAIQNNLEFDQEFANRTLREVLKAERAAAFRRKVVGWVTLPLGFIPWVGTPIQKAAEEAIAHPLEKQVKVDRQWFYLISEISREESEGSPNKAIDSDKK